MKKSLSVLISLCGLLLFTGCAGGNSTPPPRPAAITVTLTPSSAQALDVNQNVSITANVSDDSSNQGVNWTVACPAGVNTCGAMAQTNTASGAANKFNAPGNVTAAEIMTVKATSVSDPAKFQTVQVTVNPALAVVKPPPVQPQPGTVGQPFSLNLMTFVQGGTQPFTWSIKSGTLPSGLTLNANTGTVTGTPSATATAVIVAFNCADAGNPPTTLPADLQISLTINPAGTSRFKAIGSMITARKSHTATLLSDGRVLICGGDNHTLAFDTAEIFDPSTGGFSPTTGNMSSARTAHTATLLDNGKVLIAGGADSNARALSTAEIFDPKTSMFSPAGNMNVPRAFFAATRLPDGKVLVTGGLDSNGQALATAELFDQGTDQFTPTIGPMTTTRAIHAATLLSDGKVLVTGGANTALGDLYDRASNSFMSTQDGGTEASALTATSLQDSKVLVSGGFVSVLVSGGTIRCCVFKSESVVTANLFDSKSASFSPTGHMLNARSWHTATLLNDGKVLVAGGGIYFFVNGSRPHSVFTPIASAELYDPIAGSFASAGDMTSARSSQTATLLKDGSVLVTGGFDATGILATAELFQ
jgi:WD40 repeat protein